MISNLLKCGAALAALLSILLGLVFFSTIPKDLGLYRLWGSMDPFMTGVTPAFLPADPEEWNFNWKKFYSPQVQKHLQGKTAIVTGGNSGIGFDMAKALVDSGVHVTIACRSQTKCDDAKRTMEADMKQDKGGTVHTMLMDTASFASVRSFAQDYVLTFPSKSIDLLFFNAGASTLPPEKDDCVPKTKDDGIEYLFQVNYLSYHLLYRLLEPFLSNHARIIQTGSAGAFKSFSYKVATDLETLHGCSEPVMKGSDNLSYSQSKLAQDLWCKALTRRQQQQQEQSSPNKNKFIQANTFHPGLVATNFMKNLKRNAPNIQKVGKEATNYWNKVAWMDANVMPYYAWQSPDGALTGLYLATVDDVMVSGKYFHPQAIEIVNPLSDDEELQDKLWEFSDELVKDFATPLMVKPAKEEEQGNEGDEEVEAAVKSEEEQEGDSGEEDSEKEEEESDDEQENTAESTQDNSHNNQPDDDDEEEEAEDEQPPEAVIA